MSREDWKVVGWTVLGVGAAVALFVLFLVYVGRATADEARQEREGRAEERELRQLQIRYYKRELGEK